jgi:hypothetical protein
VSRRDGVGIECVGDLRKRQTGGPVGENPVKDCGRERASAGVVVAYWCPEHGAVSVVDPFA